MSIKTRLIVSLLAASVLLNGCAFGNFENRPDVFSLRLIETSGEATGTLAKGEANGCSLHQGGTLSSSVQFVLQYQGERCAGVVQSAPLQTNPFPFGAGAQR